MSPLFDNNPIFDSMDSNGTNFTEGVLFLGAYSRIIQKLHFNGEQGDRLLFHGWGDRTWTFKGLLSAPNLNQLWTILSGIEQYIDNSDSGTYYALLDSYGNTWANAQIHMFDPGEPRRSAITNSTTGFHYPGYVTSVQVKGIVSGMQQD